MLFFFLLNPTMSREYSKAFEIDESLTLSPLIGLKDEQDEQDELKIKEFLFSNPMGPFPKRKRSIVEEPVNTKKTKNETGMDSFYQYFAQHPNLDNLEQLLKEKGNIFEDIDEYLSSSDDENENDEDYNNGKDNSSSVMISNENMSVVDTVNTLLTFSQPTSTAGASDNLNMNSIYDNNDEPSFNNNNFEHNNTALGMFGIDELTGFKTETEELEQEGFLPFSKIVKNEPVEPQYYDHIYAPVIFNEELSELEKTNLKKINDPRAVELILKARKDSWSLAETENIVVCEPDDMRLWKRSESEKDKAILTRQTKNSTESRRRSVKDSIFYLLLSIIPIPANAALTSKIGVEKWLLQMTFLYVYQLQKKMERYSDFEAFMPRADGGNLSSLKHITNYDNPKTRRKQLENDPDKINPHLLNRPEINTKIQQELREKLTRHLINKDKKIKKEKQLQ